jgi:predicted RNase H-like nuclease (RuvC/YqgF family)
LVPPAAEVDSAAFPPDCRVSHEAHPGIAASAAGNANREQEIQALRKTVQELTAKNEALRKELAASKEDVLVLKHLFEEIAALT